MATLLIFAITASLVLAGCGSGSSEETETITPPPPTGDSDDVAIVEDGTVDGNSDSVTPIPIFALADCGSLPIESLAISTDLAAPTLVAQGQIFGGRIDPDTPSNQTHAWKIDLPKGSYHIFVESSTADGSFTNIGLTARLRFNESPNTSDIVGIEIDSRNREHRFLTLMQDASVLIQMEPRFGMEDYLIGFFPNGTPVPAPFFNNCPSIQQLALGSTEEFELGPIEALGAADVWYQINLDPRSYKLSHTATQSVNTNIQYTVLFYERYGQSGATTVIDRVNEIGFSNVASTQFSLSGAAPIWIRYIPSGKKYSISSTLGVDP